MTRYCPNCKSEISPLDLVCPHCGAKLEWKDPVANQSQPITPQKMLERQVVQQILNRVVKNTLLPNKMPL